ncbi:MAG: C40 family peptidase [Chloroflexota bacterium]
MRKNIAVMAVAFILGVGGIGGTFLHASAAQNRVFVSGATIAQTALTYVGKPYTNAGTRPETGFSDLGLVRYTYRLDGIRLHISVSRDAYRRLLMRGPRVKRSDLQPGDILFFKNTIWDGLSHVGIYVGSGMFVHAEWYNRGVVVSSFKNDPTDGDYWAMHYKTATRPWASR